eukprot:8605115-Alexandrium_andersonii.AAC.1
MPARRFRLGSVPGVLLVAEPCKGHPAGPWTVRLFTLEVGIQDNSSQDWRVMFTQFRGMQRWSRRSNL